MSHEWIISFMEKLGDYGFLGVTLALMIEIIPSEIVLAYGGYLIANDKLSFLSALIAGILGGTMAQVFLYWLGYYGGRPFFERFGKFLFIKNKHLDASERWFQQYGTIVIFTARFIPIVRHAISIPAGIARMRFSQFILYTTCAMLPWTILFLLLGIQLNNHWDSISDIAGKYIQPIIIIAILSLIFYFYVQYRRRTKN
ncbi:DedA family protein [Bacillus sp. FJAT-49736]|uniref:DedA family protein n=1 Tax=Bacillus sp. FJAT-49736 TaxID=2833582 RepID=UPI001BC8F920|nr:DedA family protein [Bacillus sp. FJAT-49736]MBS4173176.1 DedA family protein [Bacillus sp. FJAT-49736]